MGKKNITVTEQNGVEAFFTSRDNKSVRIKLKQEVIDRIKSGMTEDDIPHSMIEAIEKAPLEKIFEIESF